MTSIDELFKGTSKRKLDPTKDPNELYKAAKLEANEAPGRPAARAHDSGANIENGDSDDQEAGPELPLDFEEDVPDDEEGRFFGGGVSKETRGALDYVDKLEEGIQMSDKIDSPWLHRVAGNLSKHVAKNAEQRAKYESEPQSFMASEADVDADVKSFAALSEHPELYPEFASTGAVTSLIELLAHENTDIAIDVAEVLAELTDDDVEADEEQWDVLVKAMLDADLLNLLVQNLERLDESNEVDRSGVYQILRVFENLGSQTTIAEKMLSIEGIKDWLLARVQTSSPDKQRQNQQEQSVTQNRQYSAEIVAILVQSSTLNRNRLIASNAVDICLQLLAVYRRHDPERDSDEEEYMENLFDCLTCLVEEASGKDKFLEAEGVELMQIMLRGGKISKKRALRVLNHTLSGDGAGSCCERFVEVALLRTVFSTFMKKQDSEITEHILGIFASLLKYLPGDSSPRIRTLAKFVENDYEKIMRLVKLRYEYAGRLSVVDKQIASERTSRDLSNNDSRTSAQAEWLSRRLDNGLFPLQIIDVILAWLIAEDDGARVRIKELLTEKKEDTSVIQRTLREQIDDLGEPQDEDQDYNQKEMLTTLMQFV